jgi:hypothetical protein
MVTVVFSDRITTYRSAASGEVDVHPTPIFPPLVGCSGWFGGGPF